jgi:hypothetical protein
MQTSSDGHRTLELRVRVPVDGMGGTEDSLKISFLWAVQHFLYTKYLKAKSYRTIAEENDIESPERIGTDRQCNWKEDQI